MIFNKNIIIYKYNISWKNDKYKQIGINFTYLYRFKILKRYFYFTFWFIFGLNTYLTNFLNSLIIIIEELMNNINFDIIIINLL